MTETKQALNVKRVRDVETLEALRDVWNSLLEKSEIRTIEMTFEWQMSYWKYFKRNAELFVLVVQDENSIVAIAPLKLTIIKILGSIIRRLELIAAAESNYQNLIIGEPSNTIIDSLWDYLVSAQGYWDVLALRNIPESSFTAHSILNRFRLPSLWVMTDKEKCMYLEAKDGQAEYPGKKGKARRNLDSSMRKIIRDLGEICLIQNTTKDGLKSELLDFFDLHRRRWNQTDSPSQFNDVAYCNFYLEAVPQLFAKKQIRYFILEVGGVRIAQAFGFTHDKTFVGQLLAYDINYARYGPMKVLLELSTRNLISQGFQIIDFGSYDPYKEHWANQYKNRMNFIFFPKRLVPSFLYILEIVSRKAQLNIKKIPLLLKFAKSLRGKMRRLILALRNKTENCSFENEA